VYVEMQVGWDKGLMENRQRARISSSLLTPRGEVCRLLILLFSTNIQPLAIFGTYLDGPRSAASRLWYGNSKDPDLALLPRLRSLSDILWAYWVRDNPDVKNIRYLIMLGISNDQTNQLIASALKNVGGTLKEWPGTSFGMDKDEGRALLGTTSCLSLSCQWGLINCRFAKRRTIRVLSPPA
jgi:hypothetical protein